MSEHTKGYLTVQVTYSDGKRLRLVHDLVLEAFVGPRPDGQMARHHPDPTRTNNRLDNLQWGTGSENNQDTARHFRVRNQRLSEDEVWGVKLLLQLGNESTTIRQIYPNSTPKRVSAIRCEFNWGHVVVPGTSDR